MAVLFAFLGGCTKKQQLKHEPITQVLVRTINLISSSQSYPSHIQECFFQSLNTFLGWSSPICILVQLNMFASVKWVKRAWWSSPMFPEQQMDKPGCQEEEVEGGELWPRGMGFAGFTAWLGRDINPPNQCWSCDTNKSTGLRLNVNKQNKRKRTTEQFKHPNGLYKKIIKNQNAWEPKIIRLY